MIQWTEVVDLGKNAAQVMCSSWCMISRYASASGDVNLDHVEKVMSACQVNVSPPIMNKYLRRKVSEVIKYPFSPVTFTW
jgi:hypothetical protein